MSETQKREQTEGMVDSMGMIALLETLETICGEKAERLQHACQDKTVANLWLKVQNRIGLAIVAAREL